MWRWVGTAAAGLFVVLHGALPLSAHSEHSSTIRVAAASDLEIVLPLLIEEFQRGGGTKVIATFGSSGMLARQIRQGAPFDLFLSADRGFLAELAQSGHVVASSVEDYARGTLALVVHDRCTARVDGLADLAKLAVKKIAIADPELAPYGRAARQALERSGVWTNVEPRLVLAPSVRQAFEFVTTGNVEVAIVGGALARESRMRAIAIDPSSHEPITQALGVVSSTQRLADAEGLRSFLLSERGQAIFARSGFLPPGATESSPPSIPRADSGEILGPLWLSIRVAGASTLLVACLGLPLAIVLARCRFPGRSLISGISVLPLVLPPTVLGFVLLQILGRSAPLGAWLERSFGLLLVFNWPGAVIASAVAALPLFLLPAKSAIEGVNPALEDVARLLGRNEGAVFRTVTLPLAWRGVAAGLALSFARAMGDFGATLMVAGDLPGRTRTASIAIFRAVETGNLGMAALLSAAVSIISLAALGGVQRLQPASRTAA